jgi:hypothetical protein
MHPLVMHYLMDGQFSGHVRAKRPGCAGTSTRFV